MIFWRILLKSHADILKMAIAASLVALFVEQNDLFLVAAVLQYGGLFAINGIQALLLSE